MKSIFTVFLDIEKLIYKVLMWFILVPKTIAKITLNPAWAPEYVKGELENDETPFDEYISPIILLLIVALIPALAFNLLPAYGAAISSPAETQTTTDRILSFDVRTDFRSSSTQMEYFHVWSVSRLGEQPAPVVQADGSVSLVSGGLAVFEPEIHFPTSPKNLVLEVDDNTVTDKFIFNFPEPGEYLVSVTAGKYDTDRFDPQSGAGVPTETYATSLRVVVPARTDQPIVITNEQSKKDAEAAKNVGVESFTAQAQQENTIFIALALMLPPLLFALATKLFLITVGEDTLKESFYTQCYYFSPLSLAIWASYYARYFFTSDAYFYAGGNFAVQIIWLPTLLAALWFVRAEVKTIEDARTINGIRALTITLVCIAFLLFAANGIFQFATLQDDIRLFAIRIFPIVSTAFIVAFGVAWYRRRRSRNEFMKPSHFIGIAINAVVLIALLGFVSAQFSAQSQSNAISRTVAPAASVTALANATEAPTQPAVAPSQTPTAQISGVDATPSPEATASPAATESPTPNPFFVEDFNTDLASWFEFMTSGDSSLVKRKVELGALSVSLLQREGVTSRYYLINNSFSYSDVKLEAVVTNRGNNSNGVGLICRYSDIGWYEAQVSNSLEFALYVVDNVGVYSKGYNEVMRANSKHILSGLRTNIYTLTCKDNVISLFANGNLLGEFTDTHYGFTDGKIGLSVWSPQTLPVNVDVETLTISAP
ncbi:MAG: hypothetical protein IT313_10280 [Anaerolineales bacterium]|nr:hypothetical protein [Anaerolineales bacterium]